MPYKFKAPDGGVAIRMYRQGLGDCFLLTFNGDDNKPRYMLIDCGVLLGTTDATNVMKKVAEDIKKTTSGHIHVLVITHEHWDHISGFHQARSVFNSIEIDQVWMGWTENPENTLANQLKKKKKLYLDSLKIASKQIKRSNKALHSKLDGLLGFYGESIGMAAKKTSDIMHDLSSMGKNPPKFCTPGGEPQHIPGVDSARLFILGPPESKKLIKKSDPSKKHSEVYLTDIEDDILDAFAYHLLGRQENDFQLGPDEFLAGNRLIPFDDKFRVKPGESRNKTAESFFKSHYKDPKSKWRKIDDKWLDLAGELALKLDKHTNNTCLALAIELVDSKKVLLFPGDAQVGNWLGWHEVIWESDGEDITIEDILSRTVLYKVGHHGSHNATLKEKGLELMSSPDLTAMIPVDAEKAKKKGWKMPYKPLYQRLRDVCEGRILRVDKGKVKKPSWIGESTWKSFEKRIKKTNKLFIDFTIS